MNMKSIWLQFILIFIPLTFSLSHRPVDPLLDICFDGLPDVVFTSGEGETFIFKGNSYWQVVRDPVTKKISVTDSTPGVISKTWKNLPPDIDLAFTVTSSVNEWSGTRGRTIFVKKESWFQYNGKEYERESNDAMNLNLWITDPDIKGRDYFDKVISLQDEAVVIYRTRDILRSEETALLIDDPFRPDSVEVTLSQTMFSASVTALRHSSSSFYMIPAGNKSIYFFFQEGYTGYLCFLPKYNSNCESIQPISSLFDCPPSVEVVKKRDYIAWFMTCLSLKSHDLIVAFIGWQIGFLSIIGIAFYQTLGYYRQLDRK